MPDYFQLIRPYSYSLSVRPAELHCRDAGQKRRSNFSDVQLSQLTAKAKASWMLLKPQEAKHWASYQLTLSAKALRDLSVAQSELKVTFWRDGGRREESSGDVVDVNGKC